MFGIYTPLVSCRAGRQLIWPSHHLLGILSYPLSLFTALLFIHLTLLTRAYARGTVPPRREGGREGGSERGWSHPHEPVPGRSHMLKKSTSMLGRGEREGEVGGRGRVDGRNKRREYTR